MVDAMKKFALNCDRTYHSPALCSKLRSVLRAVAVGLGIAWENTRGAPFREDVGHLEIGTLEGPVKRRKIATTYKHGIMVSARNALGRGITKAGQILAGMAVAKLSGPVRRLSLAQRRRGKCGAQPVRSSSVASFADSLNYNYFVDTRCMHTTQYILHTT